MRLKLFLQFVATLLAETILHPLSTSTIVVRDGKVVVAARTPAGMEPPRPAASQG